MNIVVQVYLKVANVLIGFEEISVIVDIVQVLLPEPLLQNLNKASASGKNCSISISIILAFLISTKAWLNRACSRRN